MMLRLVRTSVVGVAIGAAVLVVGVGPAYACSSLRSGHPGRSEYEAGYLISTAAVQASVAITVPTLSCAPGQSSEVVLGLGEEAGNGYSEIGGGADVGCDNGGAFYLGLASVNPTGGVENFNEVSAGDHLVVQLSVSGGMTTVTTDDETSGLVETQTGPISSVEGLVEGAVTPGEESYLGSTDTVLPFANFGQVSFDHPMVNNVALKAVTPARVVDHGKGYVVRPGHLGQDFRLVFETNDRDLTAF